MVCFWSTIHHRIHKLSQAIQSEPVDIGCYVIYMDHLKNIQWRNDNECFKKTIYLTKLLSMKKTVKDSLKGKFAMKSEMEM